MIKEGYSFTQFWMDSIILNYTYPKWCILPGCNVNYYNIMCVCQYHQNVKLMVEGVKLNENYEDLINLLVYDFQNSDYMLDECN